LYNVYTQISYPYINIQISHSTLTALLGKEIVPGDFQAGYVLGMSGEMSYTEQL